MREVTAGHCILLRMPLVGTTFLRPHLPSVTPHFGRLARVARHRVARERPGVRRSSAAFTQAPTFKAQVGLRTPGCWREQHSPFRVIALQTPFFIAFPLGRCFVFFRNSCYEHYRPKKTNIYHLVACFWDCLKSHLLERLVPTVESKNQPAKPLY